MDSFSYMTDYKPEHPELQQNNSSIKIHVSCMEELNNLSAADKMNIINTTTESIPVIASKDETACWCHIQHSLEKNNVITPGINVYCMYVLEKYHYEEEDKDGFLKILFDSI